MTNQAPSDKVLDLIAKLAAMTVENGATEAEAATAAQKMQKLLFDYNLSLADVKVGKDKNAAQSIREDILNLDAMTRTIFGDRIIRPNERQWLVDLASAVARYNFCHILIGGQNTHIYFVGTPANSKAAFAIYEFLAHQVVRLSNEEYRALRPTTDHRVWKRNFSNGAAHRLALRLREQWEAMQEASEVGTALVVSNSAALSEYMQRYKDVGSAKRHSGRNGAGYADGYSAGERINLGRALS